MRLLLLLSTLFVLGSAIELPEVKSLSMRAAGESTCTAEDGLFCGSCELIMLCVGGTMVSSAKCAEMSAGQPYCNNGTCSSEMPSDDDCGIQSNFTCTSEGYFPDPDDCSRYYMCIRGSADASLKGYLNICPSSPKHVYNHAKGMCVRQVVPQDCAKMSCKPGVVTEKVPYPKDANIYGVCFAGKMTVMKCKPGEQLNTKTGKCEATCNEEKLMPDIDKAKYTQCTYSSPNVYKAVVYKCPADTLFDPEVLRCKSDSCGGGSSGGGSSGGSSSGGGSAGDGESETEGEPTRKLLK